MYRVHPGVLYFAAAAARLLYATPAIFALFFHAPRYSFPPPIDQARRFSRQLGYMLLSLADHPGTILCFF